MKKSISINMIGFCAFFLCYLLNSSHVMAESIEPLKQLLKPNPVTATLPHSGLFEGRGDGVVTCPVTGEKVTEKSLKAEYFGRTVYFCCHGCLKAAQQNPEKFVKPTHSEQQAAVKAYVAKAAQTDGAEYCND